MDKNEIQKKIVQKIADLNKETKTLDFAWGWKTSNFELLEDKNLENFIKSKKEDFFSILSLLGKLYRKLPKEINWDGKLMFLLGFLPRNAKKNWVTVGLLYYIIKHINSQTFIKIYNDGTLYGYIEAENNNKNIILQAHSDVVIFNNSLKTTDDTETLDYGVYGSNARAWVFKKNDLWYIEKNNDRTVLGADDGKGIVSILKILKERGRKKMVNWPRITFLITGCEEMPFAFSIREFVRKQERISLLFPEKLETRLYINLDSYSGREIDYYTHSTPAYESEGVVNGGSNWWILDQYKQLLLEKIISKHKSYLKHIIKQESTQKTAWINPPSEVLYIKDIDNKKIKECLFFSCAANSINPHSINENIELTEIKKFNTWLLNLIIDIYK